MDLKSDILQTSISLIILTKSKLVIDPDFEKDEFALVINFKNTSENEFINTKYQRIIDILNEVGYQDLLVKHEYEIGGNFIGDPPWGYYKIIFYRQQPSSKSILSTTRIHRVDEMPVSEGGTAGQTAIIAKSILSTLNLIHPANTISYP